MAVALHCFGFNAGAGAQQKRSSGHSSNTSMQPPSQLGAYVMAVLVVVSRRWPFLSSTTQENERMNQPYGEVDNTQFAGSSSLFSPESEKKHFPLEMLLCHELSIVSASLRYSLTSEWLSNWITAGHIFFPVKVALMILKKNQLWDSDKPHGEQMGLITAYMVNSTSSFENPQRSQGCEVADALPSGKLPASVDMDISIGCQFWSCSSTSLAGRRLLAGVQSESSPITIVMLNSGSTTLDSNCGSSFPQN
ncbi:uncharacterized protein RSE6_08220 [Rhynchosporium secalis]|uniref:Uncharacterized protein n=1 Tax=Rhynchosporium secalis TaxID=38038 RepID=A0A1E1MF22_RHYSE|nr:uncharacterized protein RSE6_08220 [Rhynchosporium secalis]